MTNEEFKKLWGETQRYCTFETGPAWLHFAKLVERETAKRCAEIADKYHGSSWDHNYIFLEELNYNTDRKP